MEVHHHNHSTTTRRVKWIHYTWEFLMLFLAVFCGFLAENQREHMVEHRRVKGSMKAIVENLKYDTVRCRINAESNVENELGLDSLRNELKKAIAGQVNGNALYYFILNYTGNFGQAVFNTSAITELKNSGSLRLVKSKALVVAMADYYERKVFAAKETMPTKDQVNALQKTINELFSMLRLDYYIRSFDFFNEKIYANDFNYQEILQYTPVLKLRSEEPKQLEKIYTEVTQFEIQIKKYNFC